MNSQVPSQDEQALCRCRTLYLGTSLFDPVAAAQLQSSNGKKFNESNLSLNQLQDTIAKRYPVDGSNFAKGIETWLSIFPSGVQMEHSSAKDASEISGLFYYPIKSLVYCGALRLAHLNVANAKASKFVPLDSDLAQTEENAKNPPLFIIFLKAVDSTTKKEIIECHVFVVGLKKTSMKLIESCQKAFGMSKLSVGQFYKKYGNVPVVYCLKNQLANKNDKRVVVKTHDLDGYFYATDTTPIDCWQLFETTTSEVPPIIYETNLNLNNNNNDNINTLARNGIMKKTANNANNNNAVKNNINIVNNNHSNKYNQVVKDEPVEEIDEEEVKVKPEALTIDPYEKTDNLVRVEKRVDPTTGQTIFIRYVSENKKKNEIFENEDEQLQELLYSDGKNLMSSNNKNKEKHTPIIIREDTRTPSPIIVEKYITKKSPQIIIKEIHVNEPAPPPYKVIQNIDGKIPYVLPQQLLQQKNNNSNLKMIMNSNNETNENNNNNSNFGTLMRRNPTMPPPITPPPQQQQPQPQFNPHTGNRIIYNSFSPPKRPVGQYTQSSQINTPPQIEFKNTNSQPNQNQNNINNNNNNNYSSFYSMYPPQQNNNRPNLMNTPPPMSQNQNENSSMIPKNANFYSMQPSISSEIKRYARHSNQYNQPLNEIRNRNIKYGYAASTNLNRDVSTSDTDLLMRHQRTCIREREIVIENNKQPSSNKYHSHHHHHHHHHNNNNNNLHHRNSSTNERNLSVPKYSDNNRHGMETISIRKKHATSMQQQQQQQLQPYYQHHTHQKNHQYPHHLNYNLHGESTLSRGMTRNGNNLSLMMPHRLSSNEQFKSYSRPEIHKMFL